MRTGDCKSVSEGVAPRDESLLDESGAGDLRHPVAHGSRGLVAVIARDPLDAHTRDGVDRALHLGRDRTGPAHDDDRVRPEVNDRAPDDVGQCCRRGEEQWSIVDSGQPGSREGIGERRASGQDHHIGRVEALTCDRTRRAVAVASGPSFHQVIAGKRCQGDRIDELPHVGRHRCVTVLHHHGL